MIDTGDPSRPPLVRSILSLLLFTVLVHLGYQVRIGLSPQDVGPFETILARAVAGQIDHGPGVFYGPFEGSHHSVLMHAPLYYRLVGLVAWPFVNLGFESLGTVLFVGRAISFLGTMLTLTAVFGLARLDGSDRRAGWLAAAMLATSPILGNLAAMLRPDALGVGLASAGTWLVLLAIRPTEIRGTTAVHRRIAHVRGKRGLAPGPPSRPQNSRKTLWAGCLSPFSERNTSVNRCRCQLALGTSALALAFLVKQQNLTVMLGCSVLMLLSAFTGRLPLRSALLGACAGAAVLTADLGLEQILTGGRMWRSVFVYPSGAFRSINYAGWTHVLSIFDITARKSIGLIAIAAVCSLGLRRKLMDRPLDPVLTALLAIELAALVPLSLFNAGASYNYALLAIVFASVLVGRMLDRMLTSAQARPAWLMPISAAVVALLMNDMRLVAQAETGRKAQTQLLHDLLADDRVSDLPPSARYFVKRQHWNRLAGRPDLIHDDWLYGAFEQMQAASPRELWLRQALEKGPVRQVVVPGDPPSVPGIDESLPELGYRRVARHGDLSVWERR